MNIKKIAQYIDQEKLFTREDKILVTLSGGADSVALLRLLLAMGYTCDDGITESEKAEVVRILESVGLAVEVQEGYMDAITGIAGSSPAFMYLVIDAMADAGVLNGLSRKDSIELAAQSMLGAAKMVLETGKHPDVLRDEVCSPAGTTIVGVRTLEDLGLRSAMIAAVDNTIEKSREMSRN